MKFTLSLTQQCNLRCSYCYIQKHSAVMSAGVAKKIIDEIFRFSPPEEDIDIGFFGGEPLLEFELIKQIVSYVEEHSAYSRDRVELTLVTNGTIFNPAIGKYLQEHNIVFCLSCDGPPRIQDKFRKFRDGQGSSAKVEETIRNAHDYFPPFPVNAVYHPETLDHLPEVVDYFSSLGVKRIYLNPDYSAPWGIEDVEKLPNIYNQIAHKYLDYHLQDNPHFISLIDGKIGVILKGGYAPMERCRMGTGEFAFAPSGNIYPCERLIGPDDGMHCIGHIDTGLDSVRPCANSKFSSEINQECTTCTLLDYCMTWCGCSNYFSSGDYNKVGPFMCAAEKAAINTALEVYQLLEGRFGSKVLEQLTGGNQRGRKEVMVNAIR